MAVTLSISTTDILTIARLDTADTDNIADANAIIGDGDYQEAIEQALDPAALANSSIALLLKWAVAQLCAAELIARRARADGASGTFQAAGITLSNIPDHAAQLRAEANETLAPYRLRHSATTITTDYESEASHSKQDSIFGASESDRATTREDW